MNEPPGRPIPCRQGIISPLAFLSLSFLISRAWFSFPSFSSSLQFTFLCLLPCLLALFARAFALFIPCSTFNFLAWSWTRASSKRSLDISSFILIPSNNHTDLRCIHSAPFSRRPPPRSDPPLLSALILLSIPNPCLS